MSIFKDFQSFSRGWWCVYSSSLSAYRLPVSVIDWSGPQFTQLRLQDWSVRYPEEYTSTAYWTHQWSLYPDPQSTAIQCRHHDTRGNWKVKYPFHAQSRLYNNDMRPSGHIKRCTPTVRLSVWPVTTIYSKSESHRSFEFGRYMTLNTSMGEQIWGQMSKSACHIPFVHSLEGRVKFIFYRKWNCKWWSYCDTKSQSSRSLKMKMYKSFIVHVFMKIELIYIKPNNMKTSR